MDNKLNGFVVKVFRKTGDKEEQLQPLLFIHNDDAPKFEGKFVGEYILECIKDNKTDGSNLGALLKE